MRKKDEKRKNFYTKMRYVGKQPASFNRLAKVHREKNPVRTGLSLPGNSHYNLIKVLAIFFWEN